MVTVNPKGSKTRWGQWDPASAALAISKVAGPRGADSGIVKSTWMGVTIKLSTSCKDPDDRCIKNTTFIKSRWKLDGKFPPIDAVWPGKTMRDQSATVGKSVNPRHGTLHLRPHFAQNACASMTCGSGVEVDPSCSNSPSFQKEKILDNRSNIPLCKVSSRSNLCIPCIHWSRQYPRLYLICS